MSEDRLARATELVHPSGVRVQTPLLIPSFSSKGFAFRGGQSEIANLFEVAAKGFLADSVLVSAYDIAQQLMPTITYPITEITFVDSGGYETAEMHDESTIYRGPIEPKDWDEQALKQVYDNWHPEVPATFVSFDKGGFYRPIEEQIRAAHELLKPYANLRTLLFKPEGPEQDVIPLDKIESLLTEIGEFHIIGVTEKELGGSLAERMRNIARLRKSMDSVGITAPIHVFGSLDPIGTPLYFLAGAEIFDGLSWLRYGYRQGIACYNHNMLALEKGIGMHLDQFFSWGLQQNHSYLLTLEAEMRAFASSGNFECFKYHADLLRQASEEINS